MYLKTTLLAALLVISPISSLATDGDDALFGLRWGMSISEVRAAGVALKKEQADRTLEIYSSTSAPREISNAESYVFVFSEGKLVKLRYVGKNITDDAFGTSGKEQFESLKTALTEKYGIPDNNFQNVGGRLFKEADEFYQCLAYSGCGMWVSIFKSPDKYLMLELKGIRRGTGYVSLTAEASPQWNEAMQRQKQQKNKSDKDAL